MDDLSKSELQMIPEFEDVIYNRIIPNVKDELTLDVPYQTLGDWE